MIRFVALLVGFAFDAALDMIEFLVEEWIEWSEGVWSCLHGVVGLVRGKKCVYVCLAVFGTKYEGLI